MKFTLSATVLGLAMSAMANPFTLSSRDSTDCCNYQSCTTNCANGFPNNAAGQAACISSCADVNNMGSDACYCCSDGSQQHAGDGDTACANNGGIGDGCSC